MTTATSPADGLPEKGDLKMTTPTSRVLHASPRPLGHHRAPRRLGRPATNVVVVNPGTITATRSEGTGTVNVTVSTPGGTSATSAADRFCYTVSSL